MKIRDRIVIALGELVEHEDFPEDKKLNLAAVVVGFALAMLIGLAVIL